MKKDSCESKNLARLQKKHASRRSVQMQRINNGKLIGGVTGKGFIPGQSGNPGGRPKGSTKISTAYQRSLARLVPDDPEGRTYAQYIADKTVELAAQGNLTALKEVTDRVEGKSPRVIEIERSDLTRQNWLNVIEELSAKYGKSREQVIRDLIDREPDAAELLL
jgi:hypothetical protein